VPNGIVYAILAFIFFYFIVIVGVTLVLMLSGMEVVTAFSASIAWINNIGPALNELGPVGNYAKLTDFQKWVGIVAMLAGRLELFTVLVLFTPAFWRK
jgi:trk system potassium uptake protein TrkH